LGDKLTVGLEFVVVPDPVLSGVLAPEVFTPEPHADNPLASANIATRDQLRVSSRIGQFSRRMMNGLSIRNLMLHYE